MFVLIPLFVATVLIVSIVLFLGITNIVQDQVSRQATIFQVQKTAELEQWAAEKQTGLAAATATTGFTDAIGTL